MGFPTPDFSIFIFFGLGQNIHKTDIVFYSYTFLLYSKLKAGPTSISSKA